MVNYKIIFCLCALSFLAEGKVEKNHIKFVCNAILHLLDEHHAWTPYPALFL